MLVNFRCWLDWLKTQTANTLTFLWISVKILLEHTGVWTSELNKEDVSKCHKFREGKFIFPVPETGCSFPPELRASSSLAFGLQVLTPAASSVLRPLMLDWQLHHWPHLLLRVSNLNGTTLSYFSKYGQCILGLSLTIHNWEPVLSLHPSLSVCPLSLLSVYPIVSVSLSNPDYSLWWLVLTGSL